MTADHTTQNETRPELSLVMPCYNEENCLEKTVPPLAHVFEAAGVDLEIILVDNGSTDGTSQVIDQLIARGLPVVKGVVKVNQGQGLGILTGLRISRGEYVGYLCADGQVGPESVLVIYRALRSAHGQTLAKARRRFRQDSWIRKIVSIQFNALMLLLFPGIPSLDVNGNPKIMPADVLRMMELSSRDWFLEAEVMLKARHLRLLVIEIDVPGCLRRAGVSNVRMQTVLEFARNILSYRFGGPWRRWCQRTELAAIRQVNAP
jgi:glycosyltransferase involved in cell wall biosynthesis